MYFINLNGRHINFHIRLSPSDNLPRIINPITTAIITSITIQFINPYPD